MRVLCEWGTGAIEAYAARVAAVVVVDVLSFSTAVDVAVARGAVVYPFPWSDPAVAEDAAAAVSAVLAKPRRAAGGQFSLSPQSLLSVEPGVRIMLPSPNGSRLSLEVRDMPVLAGCLRNARQVAAAALRLADGGDVLVVPAGERWPNGTLRPAIEDWLGAGAIIDGLQGELSAEAETARQAYRCAGDDIASLVRGSVSGQELTDAGFAADVDLAVAVNVSATAPVLLDGAYRALAGVTRQPGT